MDFEKEVYHRMERALKVKAFVEDKKDLIVSGIISAVTTSALAGNKNDLWLKDIVIKGAKLFKGLCIENMYIKSELDIALYHKLNSLKDNNGNFDVDKIKELRHKVENWEVKKL